MFDVRAIFFIHIFDTLFLIQLNISDYRVDEYLIFTYLFLNVNIENTYIIDIFKTTILLNISLGIFIYIIWIGH